jgi:TrmH family RNA methyltransferase
LTVHQIYSENAAYQELAALKTNRNKRRRLRSFIVEGVRGIDAAIHYGWRIESLLYARGVKLSRWAGGVLESAGAADAYELPPTLMERLSGKTETSELIAVARMRGAEECARPGGTAANAAARTDSSAPALSESPVLALFDRPSNKGNLGALLRSCDAFGVEALYITGHAVDIYDPEVVVSSMGSFFAVPFYELASSADVDRLFARLKAAHPTLSLIGTSAHAALPVDAADLRGPVMFLIGNEADGLSWRLSHICDAMVNIPMGARSFASSLNVSCAATTLFYEVSRQRRACAPNKSCVHNSG